MEKAIHTKHWKVLISCESRFLWTTYLMFWHCYPCKCSAQCLWMLRALFCTWIARVVGDHLILKRWWLTHAFISVYAPLWCWQRGRQHEKQMQWERHEKEERRGEREGKTKETSTKEADRKHRNGNGKSLITMYYQCMATCTGKVFTKTVAT